MQILANDGTPFNSVNACLAYEAKKKQEALMEERARRLRDEQKNVAKYIVQHFIADDGEIKKSNLDVIFVHTLSNHKLVAESVAESIFGQSLGFKGNIPVGANIYHKYKLKRAQSSEDLAFCDAELACKRAIVVELNDVPKIFSMSEHRTFTPSIGGQALYKRQYEEQGGSAPDDKYEDKSVSGEDKKIFEDTVKVWRVDDAGYFHLLEVRESEVEDSDLPENTKGITEGKHVLEYALEESIGKVIAPPPESLLRLLLS